MQGLRTIELTKSFGKLRAVDSISFDVTPGAAFGLLGRNGAGKTTIIRMIMQIILCDSGKVLYNDKEIAKSGIRIGYLPEERGLYPRAQVEEQLLYFARLRGMSKHDALASIKRWFARFNMEENLKKTTETLSKGNQQKVQLIQSIIHDPELVILDEPFSGLDPVNAQLLKDVVKELIVDGKCLVFSSHQMDYVEEFCRDVIIMRQGKAVVQGNLSDIKNSFGRNKLLIKTDDKQSIARFLKDKGVSDWAETASAILANCGDETAAMRLMRSIAASELSLVGVEIARPSLHEIFVMKAGDE